MYPPASPRANERLLIDRGKDSTMASTLLCQAHLPDGSDFGDDEWEELPDEEALETAHDLLARLLFALPTFGIGACPGIAPHADDGDRPEGVVRLTITAAIEGTPDGQA